MRKVYFFILQCIIVMNISMAQNVGIGTLTPTDKLHVNAASATNPLLIQINSVNKLRVNANGGTTIGSANTAPADGLYVAGVTNPVGGIRSSSNPINIQSTNDSVEIVAGQNKIVVFANGGIRIITANGTSGITIDAGAGDLNLKGNNINITATNKCITNANKLFTVSTDSTYFSTIDGNIAIYAARNTVITSAINLTATTGASSTISTGAAMSITTGANMDITTGGFTSIYSNGKFSITAGSNMDVAVNNNYSTSTGGAMITAAGAGYSVTAADVNIKAFGTSRILGSLVLLNNGTKPAARYTDAIQVLYTNGTGIINGGSATVLIGD